jgi:hypothetical protein
MRFERDGIPTPAPTTTGVDVDGETVLLDRRTGALHQLNPSGAAIWSLLDGSRTVGSIVDELSATFGVEPDGVARDVDEFLCMLARLGLLSGQDAAAPAASRKVHGLVPSSIDTLWVDWFTAQVLDALQARGIEAILLKGPAFRRWLYQDDPEQRGYIDADLLVESGNLDTAARVLSTLGFAPEDSRGLESIYRWATAWRRRADGAVVDLHRTLHGCEHSPVDPWPILRPGAVREDVGGHAALLPSVPARAVQVVLVSPADRPWRKWDDLQRALEQLPLNGWREAAAIATALGVDRLFGYRLSQSPAGLACAQRIGAVTAPTWWLRWEADPALRWIALLASVPTWRLRIGLVRRLLLPSPGYVRVRDPDASRRGLLASYLSWAGHLSRLLPGAVRTLLRSVSRGGTDV